MWNTIKHKNLLSNVKWLKKLTFGDTEIKKKITTIKVLFF